MLRAHNHNSAPTPISLPRPHPVPAVSGSLLAVGLPNVLKSTEVETSANRLWSPNGLYLFMQALASPQDSVALTQEDSRTSKKRRPFIRVTQHFRPMSRQMFVSAEGAAHFCWWLKNKRNETCWSALDFHLLSKSPLFLTQRVLMP